MKVLQHSLWSRSRCMHVLFVVVFALLILAPVTAWGAEPTYGSIDEAKDGRIGVPNGTAVDQLLEERLGSDVDLSYFNSDTDAISALRSDKIDAYATDKMHVLLAVNTFSDLAMIPEKAMEDEYGFAFPIGSDLVSLFNEQIEALKADGTLDGLEEKWVGADASAKKAISQDWDAPRGTLKVGVVAMFEPTCYVGEGEMLGYDPELLSIIGRNLGYHMEYVQFSDVGSAIAALQTGKVDMLASGISITEERTKMVDFTIPYYISGIYLVVKAADGAISDGPVDQLISGFNRSLIVENRWKMIISGLAVTILISLLSGLFGLLFGYGLCQMRRSQNKVASKVAAAIIRIVQGIPVLVLLMLMFYVMFAQVDLSGIVVAVLAFSVNFGVYAAEIIRAGIEGVDKGQTEAAIALGYTPRQAFWKVVFPQAAKQFMPVLRGEFISMVKMTSVVGYVAVEDLTRVSDIIRSRTLDAFFPLILTALLYFIIANLLAYLLMLIDRKLDTRNRPLEIKGVDLR